MQYFKGSSLIYLGLALSALGIHAYSSSLAHILVSLLAMATLGLATLQALVITLQSHLLKQRPLQAYPILNLLPPVETMQDALFKVIGAGFVFLSLSFIGAFIFLPSVLENIQTSKLVLCSLAWVLFAVLLFGYHRYGWRNNAVTYCTLLGIILLTRAIFL